jgi:hypothetical protein
MQGSGIVTPFKVESAPHGAISAGAPAVRYVVGLSTPR